MIKKRLLVFAPVLLVLLLAGCTAHYRNAIDEYRKNEPSSFYRKTLDWSESTPTAQDSTTTTPIERIDLRPESSPDEQEKFHELASDFFGITPERFREIARPLDTKEELDQQLSRRLVWEELQYAVALHNPDVAAAQERWRATLNQYSQASFLDNLITEYRGFSRYLNVGAGKPLNKGMTHEFFPYPSTISIKGELIDEQVRLAELDWRKALRDAVVEAGQLYYDYRYFVEAANATRENVDLVQSMLEVIQDQYQSGRADQSDLLKVQTELEKQKNLLEDLQAGEEARVASINALLNRPVESPLGAPEPEKRMKPAPEFDSLRDAAHQYRQEILMARTKTARTEIAIRLAEVMNRPGASAGYSQFERGKMAEASVGKSMQPYGLKRKSPDRPAYAQAESYLAEMRKRLDAERKNVEQVVTTTDGMAKKRLRELDIARRQIQLIVDIILPQDESAYETIMTSYQSGRSSFLDLLDAQRELINARLQLHEAWRSYSKIRVGLAEISGRMAETKSGE